MESARQAQHFRIMVTDSNSRVRDLLQREMEDEGYVVFATKNGQEVLDRISSPEALDLIILDPQLFYPYGIQALGTLTATPHHVPIIIHGFHDQRPPIDSLENVFFVEKDANSIKKLKAAIRSCMSKKTGSIA